MSKAFTKENDADEDEIPVLSGTPVGVRNYITPCGYADLRRELLQLLNDQRPRMVEVVRWAAGNGDRSENGDYHYGKKRLREIDRRIRFLTQRLELAEVIDPAMHFGGDQVFFGATVTYTDADADADGTVRTVTILGIDEADSAQNQVSWVSPIACAMLKAYEGDVISLRTPSGMHEIKVLRIAYPAPGTLTDSSS